MFSLQDVDIWKMVRHLLRSGVTMLVLMRLFHIPWEEALLVVLVNGGYVLDAFRDNPLRWRLDTLVLPPRGSNED